MLPSWRMLCAKRLNYFSLRRRTISLSDLAFLLRVLRPSAGLPHGVDGALRPTGALPGQGGIEECRLP